MHRRTTLGVALAVVGALAAPATPAAAHDAAVTVSVDAARPAGPVNPNLVGFGATATPAELLGLGTRTFRLDASLQDLVTCPSGLLDGSRVAALQRRIDALDARGAQVILIIDYLPPCLAALAAGDTRDPTRRPPADPARWQQIVTQLVRSFGPDRAAAGRRPVRYYEVWNEPDLTFFQGTIDEFVTGLLLPEGRAVARVARASGLDLRFGVCGCALLALGWMPQLLTATRHAGIPVGFLSWHWYGNDPFLGPDGREPGVPPALYRALAGRNPATTPQDFAGQVAQVRAWARSILRHVPELVVDEWNLSAGGFDRRMDTEEDAAYQAASLAVLAASGLDRALLYTARDPQTLDADGNPLPARYGGWGVLDRAGTRKPAWYAQWMWQQLSGRRLASPQDPTDGVWTAAARARGDGDVAVLLASFLATGAHGHALRLRVTGLRPGRWRIRLYRVDADRHGSTEPDETRTARVGRDRVLLVTSRLPAQSVLLARLEAPDDR